MFHLSWVSGSERQRGSTGSRRLTLLISVRQKVRAKDIFSQSHADGPAAMKELTEDSYSKFLGVSKLRNTVRFQRESSGKDYLRCCTKRRIHLYTCRKEVESCEIMNKYGKGG